MKMSLHIENFNVIAHMFIVYRMFVMVVFPILYYKHKEIVILSNVNPLLP